MTRNSAFRTTEKYKIHARVKTIHFSKHFTEKIIAKTNKRALVFVRFLVFNLETIRNLISFWFLPYDKRSF